MIETSGVPDCRRMSASSLRAARGHVRRERLIHFARRREQPEPARTKGLLDQRQQGMARLDQDFAAQNRHRQQKRRGRARSIVGPLGAKQAVEHEQGHDCLPQMHGLRRHQEEGDRKVVEPVMACPRAENRAGGGAAAGDDSLVRRNDAETWLISMIAILCLTGDVAPPASEQQRGGGGAVPTSRKMYSSCAWMRWIRAHMRQVVCL